MLDINYQEELLNLKEAAEFLRVPVKSIRSWVRHGRIKPVKIGRRHFYRPHDLMVYFNSFLWVMDPFISMDYLPGR